ncbi:DUF3592 domain-containing protein [Streptomyces sp. NPDC005435]|uniref:DUF3592 domain-containing protein n=1 Tax=Streptomyces sp. NPDC005435 TaxID=3154464 RepID=UPI0034550EE9
MKKQASGNKGVRWLVWGFLAAGVLFLGIGVALGGMSVSFLSSAERAQGTVIALNWGSSHSGYGRSSRGSGGPSAHPVVTFRAKDGEQHMFTSSAGSNPPAYDRGESVEVLYRANDPDDARINGFLSLWLLPVVFGGLGVVFTAIGTVIGIVIRKQSRSAAVPAS